jgi:hypothetical protein
MKLAAILSVVLITSIGGNVRAEKTNSGLCVGDYSLKTANGHFVATRKNCPTITIDEDVGAISCLTITDKGWSNMPDVTDYVKARPNASILGYGSPCRIDSLVFAQCFLEPQWSVKKAVDTLFRKALTGKRLPDTPVCGA